MSARTWTSRLAGVVLMMLPLAARPEDCAKIADKGARLECYDRAAGGSAPSAEPKSKSSAETSGRCQATTKKGAQCKRNAQPGRSYCYQH